MARARLFSPLGATRGTSVEIDGVVTVGRDRDHAVVIDDGLISKDHARISFDDSSGSFLLEDLGSTNGTALDGVPVAGVERLDRLHVITFAGRHELVFQDLRGASGGRGALPARPQEPRPPVSPRPDDPVTEPIDVTHHGQEAVAVPQALVDALDPQAAVERTQAHEIPPAIPGALGGPTPPQADPAPARADPPPARTDPAPSAAGLAGGQRPMGADGAAPSRGDEETAEPLPGAPSPFILEVRFHEGRPERFTLHYGDNLVGRIDAAEVQLKNEHISRRHAVLAIGAERIVLRDRGSNNHTYVGGEKLQGEVEIHVGDRLRFGPLEARVICLDTP